MGKAPNLAAVQVVVFSRPLGRKWLTAPSKGWYTGGSVVQSTSEVQSIGRSTKRSGYGLKQELFALKVPFAITPSSTLYL